MSRTIYVVTSGCYSNYSIGAMFSKRAPAEEYVEFLRSTGSYPSLDADIEEWTLDVPREELRGAWEVTIDNEGNVRESAAGSYHKPSEPARHNSSTAAWLYHSAKAKGQPHRFEYFDVDEFTGFGLTEEHARRSAEEMRRALVAKRGKLPDEYDKYLAAKREEAEAKP